MPLVKGDSRGSAPAVIRRAIRRRSTVPTPKADGLQPARSPVMLKQCLSLPQPWAARRCRACEKPS